MCFFFCTLFAHIICFRYNLGGCQCRCSFCYHKEHVRYDSREILALIMNGIANLCGFEMCAQLYITTNEVHIFYYKPSTKWLVKFFSNFSRNLYISKLTKKFELPKCSCNSLNLKLLKGFFLNFKIQASRLSFKP